MTFRKPTITNHLNHEVVASNLNPIMEHISNNAMMWHYLKVASGVDVKPSEHEILFAKKCIDEYFKDAMRDPNGWQKEINEDIIVQVMK